MFTAFFHVETTGHNHTMHGIHKIALILSKYDSLLGNLIYNVQPFDGNLIDEEALSVSNTSIEALEKYPKPAEVSKQLIQILAQYINPYERGNRFHLVGFNNRSFGDLFLRTFLERCRYIWGNFFFSDTIDTSVLASQYFAYHNLRSTMPNFTLDTVADALDINLSEYEHIKDETLLKTIKIKEIYTKVTEPVAAPASKTKTKTRKRKTTEKVTAPTKLPTILVSAGKITRM